MSAGVKKVVGPISSSRVVFGGIIASRTFLILPRLTLFRCWTLQRRILLGWSLMVWRSRMP